MRVKLRERKWDDKTARLGTCFHGETFRVLEETEQKLHGEYRMRRLVLDA